MKKKIAKQKKIFIITVSLCVVITIVSYYFIFNDLIRFTIAGLSSSIAIYWIFSSLFEKPQIYITEEMNNGAKIKVLSLFEIRTVSGTSTYVYEIQYENGGLDLLHVKTKCFEIGTNYVLKRTEEWLVS